MLLRSPQTPPPKSPTAATYVPPPPRTIATPSRQPLSRLAAIKGGTPLKKTPNVKTAPPTDPIEQLLQASARSQRQAVGDRSSDDSTDDWNPVDYDGL